MARLINTLMDPGTDVAYGPGGRHVLKPLVDWGDFVRRNHPAIEVVVADNVAEWVTAHFNYDRAVEDVGDTFPNIAPPWPLFWLDFRMPDDYVRGKYLRHLVDAGVTDPNKLRSIPRYVGTLVFANRPEEWRGVLAESGLPRAAVRGSVADSLIFGNALDLCDRRPGAGWVMSVVPFVEFENFPGALMQGPIQSVAVRPDGSMMDSPVMNVDMPKGFNLDNYIDADRDNGRAISAHHLYMVFAALMFLNCKNVVTTDVPAPERLNRKRVARGRAPLLSYKVLSVGALGEEIRRAAARSGASGVTGLLHGLSLCRGHFKTYTADRPLLGKHVGRFYWDESAKGDAARGVIVKDYVVLTDAQRHAVHAEADRNPTSEAGRLVARVKRLMELKEQQQQRRRKGATS